MMSQVNLKVQLQKQLKKIKMLTGQILMERKVVSMLMAIRLKERKNQLAATLSGGELQMLCIGRGLMSSPKMIMLDEPSAALAPQIVLDIFKNINKIRKDGLTVLVVEQNVRMALLLSDYGYVIKDGVINVEGDSKKLMYDDSVKDSYLGGTKANV
jgi:branched-chain amino acid transport system ATP-binding protein